ncbi:MAG: NADH:ubiquinone reductase (Na(+)-transporting) subunit D [Lentisphaerales bacterium]|jgi:Na+-transporting NADH:ubiquinone oxidoreductase subunit D|nr:MAG: NADH:ubiquinone reductase (Na(+)-transporting) subunit D [Lentisphaerales bacterium]
MSLKSILGKKAAKIVKSGLWFDHPISCATLGVCSALAISNKVENAIAMSLGVTFVLVLTAVIISSLRKLIPSRVRIITYMITIASGVTIVDLILKAFFPAISEAMGPYVPLIITNCIIMGRAEAFFLQNNPYHSVVDAVSNGLAYAYTLVLIAVIREILGFGTLLGWRVMPEAWVDWVVMAAPAGAFFILGVFLWITRTLADVKPPGKG